MKKQNIDFLVDEKLGSDKSRVVELFESAEILDELNRRSKIEDWFHFERKSYDGVYLVKSGKDFICYYQERGRVLTTKRFQNLSDAASYFFRAEGYIDQ